MGWMSAWSLTGLMLGVDGKRSNASQKGQPLRLAERQVYLRDHVVLLQGLLRHEEGRMAPEPVRPSGLAGSGQTTKELVLSEEYLIPRYSP